MCLKSLCSSDVLLSSAMYKWATLEVDNISNQTADGANTMAVVPAVPSSKIPPPLSPNTLYHASLCSRAVNSCSKTREVHDFLNQNSHRLQEASLSPQTETVDQYLIAKNGNTIYVAFRSEPSLTQWIQSRYNTFEEGLISQGKLIPLRFFIEQLLKNQKIVLTGFSFGGMLACCVTTNLWRASFLNADLLQKNVTCVTFGQPLIRIPYVQDTIKNFPQLEHIIHLVVNREDPLPKLLYHFGIGCLLKAESLAQNGAKQVKSASPLMPAGADTDQTQMAFNFQKPFSSKFLNDLAALQGKQSSSSGLSYSSALLSDSSKTKPTQMLSNMKELLLEIVSKLNAEGRLDLGLLFGNIHLMLLEEGKGLTWKGKVTKKVAAQEFCFNRALIEKLDTSNLKTESMEDYHYKLLRSYFEKQHSDAVPSSTDSQTKVQGVKLLKPVTASVEFHMYPDEHVIVLEGNNLWFCCKVSLGDGPSIEIDSAPNNVTRRSVQFNFDPSPQTESIVVDGHVTVTLYSHFSDPVKRTIQAKEEPYLFSLRQIQLAKHTPTEVIQLAYCTAMLERTSKSETGSLPSNRFELVKNFLEEAAKIVPLESVFYAIAYGGKDTALQCVQALQASGLSFPPSQMMLTGVRLAELYVCTGMTEEEYECASNSLPHPWDDLNFPMDTPSTGPETSTLSGIAPPFGIPSLFGMSGQLPADFPSPPPPRRPVSLEYTASRPRYSDVASGQASSTHSEDYISIQIGGLLTLPVPIPVPTLPQNPLDPDAACYMQGVFKDIIHRAALSRDLPVISNRSIEHFCPFSLRRSTTASTSLQSPIQALQEARDRLRSFVEESSNPNDVQTTLEVHTEMTRVVQDIRDRNLKTCASLIAAFMEQQIQIPMLKTNIDTAKVLSAVHTQVAVGVWAFMSMGFAEIEGILSSSAENSLLVEMEDYITGVMEYGSKSSESKDKRKPPDRKYAEKLEFLVTGIKREPTVTCSKQYISYCLEHQLHELAKQLKFDKSVSVKELVERWDSIFKDDALSLVAKSHRPLIARWLKWALLVHGLRETLASYTCIGIIGLSNSGKSLLVNTLFKIQTQVGTTESKRTVVPFLYNMDGKVDNLDVIDFPGVDDKDSVPELANLLVSLAQVVIFVVNYRESNSESVKEWLKRLEKEDNIHVHVCLTHADWLYTELEKEQGATNKAKMIHLLRGELNNIEEKLGRHPSRTVKFYCFNLAGYDQLTFETLRQVEIYSPKDVGDWLVQTVEDKLTQSKLGTDLAAFFDRKE